MFRLLALVALAVTLTSADVDHEHLLAPRGNVTVKNKVGQVKLAAASKRKLSKDEENIVSSRDTDDFEESPKVTTPKVKPGAQTKTTKARPKTTHNPKQVHPTKKRPKTTKARPTPHYHNSHKHTVHKGGSANNKSKDRDYGGDAIIKSHHPKGRKSDVKMRKAEVNSLIADKINERNKHRAEWLRMLKPGNSSSTLERKLATKVNTTAADDDALKRKRTKKPRPHPTKKPKRTTRPHKTTRRRRKTTHKPHKTTQRRRKTTPRHVRRTTKPHTKRTTRKHTRKPKTTKHPRNTTHKLTTPRHHPKTTPNHMLNRTLHPTTDAHHGHQTDPEPLHPDTTPENDHSKTTTPDDPQTDLPTTLAPSTTEAEEETTTEEEAISTTEALTTTEIITTGATTVLDEEATSEAVPDVTTVEPNKSPKRKG